MKTVLLPAALLLLAASLPLAGCAGSPSSRFYTLTPLARPEARKTAANPARQLRVGIAPVEIPDYLDRPQIVTREGENGLKLAEYDRWGGSLAENISDVLAEDLAQMLGTDRVFVAPWAPSQKADYLVTLRILRLDLIPGDRVLLKAQWTLASGNAGDQGSMHLSSFTQRVKDKSYQSAVAAVNQAVAQVSREIALEIAKR